MMVVSTGLERTLGASQSLGPAAGSRGGCQPESLASLVPACRWYPLGVPAVGAGQWLARMEPQNRPSADKIVHAETAPAPRTVSCVL